MENTENIAKIESESQENEAPETIGNIDTNVD